MKKQYRLTGIVLVIAGLLSSCGAEVMEDTLQATTGKEVVLNTSILYTRTATTDDKTIFLNNDAIGVFGVKRGSVDIIHENLNYQYNEGKWTAEYSITFPIDGSSLNFYAYYPYVPNVKQTCFEFTVALDQSVDGYEKSDLLLAKNEMAKVDDTAITLTFAHKLAMVQAEILLPEGETIEKVDVYARKTVMVDLVQQTATVKSDDEESYITMQKVGEKFRAVVPAQELSKGKVFRIVTKNGTIYWYKTTENIRLSGNMVTTFSVDCSKS